MDYASLIREAWVMTWRRADAVLRLCAHDEHRAVAVRDVGQLILDQA